MEQVKWPTIVVLTTQPVKQPAHNGVTAFEGDPCNHAPVPGFAGRHPRDIPLDLAEATGIRERAIRGMIDSLEAAWRTGQKTGATTSPFRS